MVQKKNPSSKSASARPLTKSDLKDFVAPLSIELRKDFRKDMLEYVGPAFEEVKYGLKKLETKLEAKIEHEVGALKNETHRLGILMEDMNTEMSLPVDKKSLASQDKP